MHAQEECAVARLEINLKLIFGVEDSFGPIICNLNSKGELHPMKVHFSLLSLHVLNSQVKSVQSALSDLLTTSATHGRFSRPSTKRGLILIGLELNTNARESFEHC